MSEAQKIRHAIIGVGALVFNMHRPAMYLPTTEVAAVCDIREEAARERGEELGAPYYTDYRQMLAEVRPEVTVIMTPHYLHAQMAIEAMEAGSHVLVEKPMAINTADADRMVAVSRETGKLLAVNFQQRLRPEVQRARELIREGKLGQIQRVELVVPWPRSYRYYSLASWRATWWGEGGGVLLNQAPHDLDLICHLAGSPNRVFSWNRTRLHQVEVEDTVTAMMEWENGALGYLRVSTAESGPKGNLTIVGTGGTLEIGTGRLMYSTFEADVYEFLRTTNEIYSGPMAEEQPVDLPEGSGDHPAVYANLHEAIQRGTPLSSNGEEGVMSLELANALILSSHAGREVNLPIDRQEYSSLLARLQRESKNQP